MNKDNDVLHVTKFIPAPQKNVFEAWTTPGLVERWFFPVGMKSVLDYWDAEVDGSFRISIIDDEDVYSTYGDFKEVSPFHKLVFTYGWEEEESVETLVTVELRNRDDGTDVVLSHEGIDADEIDAHREGWLSALSNLAKLYM